MEVKKRAPKGAWFFIFLVIGLLVGMTQFLAPLHEIAHATVANNNGIADTAITGWDTMRMRPFDRPALLAGWISQVLFCATVAVILAMIGRYPKTGWMTGGFWLGAAFTHWVRAFGSSDFHNRIREYYQAQFPNNPVQALAYYNAYRYGLEDAWWRFGIWVFIITGLIVILCATIKKKNPGLARGSAGVPASPIHSSFGPVE